MFFSKISKMLEVVAIIMCVATLQIWTLAAELEQDSVFVPETVLGEGTQESPYLLSDRAGLEFMAELTGNGQTDGVYFKLSQNISLGNPGDFLYTDGEVTQASAFVESWTPVGTQSAPFEGVFDGDDYSITGMYCCYDASCSGLFGIVDSAVIKDLYIDFSLVEAKEYAGLLAGKAQGKTEISGCVVSGSVIGKQQELASVTGGIVGVLSENSKVYDCCFYGAVSGSNAYSSDVGGIAGINKGKIEKSTFEGKAYGVSMYFNANVGGVAGSNYGEITGCLSVGTVGGEALGEVNDCSVGGIAGYSEGFVSQCKNESTVNGYCAFYENSMCAAGGIVGYLNNSDIYGCENLGEITGQEGAISGGIAGVSVVDSGEHKIYDCLNNGSVSSQSGIAGGICARVSASGAETNKNQVVKCVNTASVSGVLIGGVAGKIYTSDGAAVNASNCYYPAGYIDGFAQGSASVAVAGFTSGTALDGLTNAAVWVFEKEKMPYIIFADGLAKNTSMIIAESTQLVELASGIEASGVGQMSVSCELVSGKYDVIVRFSGDEDTFAPRPVVVNVTAVKDFDKLEMLSSEFVQSIIENGVVKYKHNVLFYSPAVDLQYTVIDAVYVDGVYVTFKTTPMTTQNGVFCLELETNPVEASLSNEENTLVKTMVVTDAESFSPVCEDIDMQ